MGKGIHHSVNLVIHTPKQFLFFRAFSLQHPDKFLQRFRRLHCIVRLPVRLLHRMKISGRPVQPYGSNPITVSSGHIFLQIVSNHNDEWLISFRQPHLLHGGVKHDPGRLLLSHHLGDNPLLEAVSQPVFPVHIPEGFPLAVRHKGDTVALLLQLPEYFPRPRDKRRFRDNPSVVVNLRALVNNSVSAVCKYDQIFIHSLLPSIMLPLPPYYQRPASISTRLLFFGRIILHFLLLFHGNPFSIVQDLRNHPVAFVHFV